MWGFFFVDHLHINKVIPVKLHEPRFIINVLRDGIDTDSDISENWGGSVSEHKHRYFKHMKKKEAVSIHCFYDIVYTFSQLTGLNTGSGNAKKINKKREQI